MFYNFQSQGNYKHRIIINSFGRSFLTKMRSCCTLFIPQQRLGKSLNSFTVSKELPWPIGEFSFFSSALANRFSPAVYTEIDNLDLQAEADLTVFGYWCM